MLYDIISLQSKPATPIKQEGQLIYGKTSTNPTLALSGGSRGCKV
jgi:hypothetical protein